MIRIPRIALFKPDQDCLLQTQLLFQAYEYSLRVVTSSTEIVELTKEEGAAFDAIIIPFKLADAVTGSIRCLEIKELKVLKDIPLIGLINQAEESNLEAFYNSGAEVILTAPVLPANLYYVINSINALHKNFNKRLEIDLQASSLHHPLSEAFNSIREGILLFNTNNSIYFANSAALSMFGINHNQNELDLISEQFKYAVKEHYNRTQLKPGDLSVSPSAFEIELLRPDEQSFAASLMITSLGNVNQPVGYSVSITDLSEVDHLTNMIIQGQRTRTLCLLTTASSVSFLENVYKDVTISPLRYIKKFIGQAPQRCPLSAAITCLLESLDLIINPDIIVKMDIEEDLNLALTMPDFFQLMGQLILHAVEHIGIKGELNFHSTANIPGEGIVFTISGRSTKLSPFLVDDRLSNLIRSETAYLSEEDGNNRVNFGLTAAQEIANKYRTQLLYQLDSESNTLKMRVNLPASGS